MAYVDVGLFNASWNPESGDIFPEVHSVQAVNDLTEDQGYVFANTGTRIKGSGSIHTPRSELTLTTAELLIWWWTTATTGTIEFEFGYISVAAGETGDPSAFTRTLSTGGITVPAAARELVLTTLALTIGDFGSDELVYHEFARDGLNDTAASSAIVKKALVRFRDS